MNHFSLKYSAEIFPNNDKCPLLAIFFVQFSQNLGIFALASNKYVWNILSTVINFSFIFSCLHLSIYTNSILKK